MNPARPDLNALLDAGCTITLYKNRHVTEIADPLMCADALDPQDNAVASGYGDTWAEALLSLANNWELRQIPRPPYTPDDRSPF
ncbi:hypothetical protein HD597_000194 [Nonomuraea thailandensis]|uniref:Uncharacterized protein n=1 Tax=Nonomuraea thailandensis TaxID=1188745 RepID=A0A9X2G5X6_9ACTN|nr:hypothetical protein [Nonomuraea thailandensis]MCP2353174.1 hypothetical protein [Nonomuraea thailandensis]